ncbi:MAG: TauD/TfdA family dioxygenase [Gammaproteobacteria bacterium]
MNARITRLAPALGAKVIGMDLSDPVDDGTLAALSTALAQHGVLVFPGQAISDAAHVRFARCFGEPGVFRPKDNPQGLEPEIFRLANTDLDGNLLPADSERLQLQQLNWTWHTDGSYRATPNKSTILHGIEVVTNGGDTVFSNMVAAYEELSTAMKARLTGLTALHDFEHQVKVRNLPPMSGEERECLPAVQQPLVRRHPDGRRSLFLSPPYMESIIGWNRSEGVALIEELTAWATQERFLYRHRWEPDDILMWDNDWTMHRVTPFDISGRKRVMHGVTIPGTRTVVPASFEDW